MERGRIAEVHAGAYGTGYLVAPDLVLTAGHVIADPAAIAVRFLDDDSELPGELVWRGSAVDAALVRVDRAATPVRWGRLVSSAGGTPAEVAGFPAAQKLADGRRGTDRLTGTLDALAGAPHHVEFLLAAAEPIAESPWTGLSGAAVFCHDLLTALVVQSLDAYGHRRLPTVPVERCLVDPAFRELLGDPVLEPVELAPILRPPTQFTPTSPASLLRADAEVVRFVGRTTELAELTSWCDGPSFGDAPSARSRSHRGWTIRNPSLTHCCRGCRRYPGQPSRCPGFSNCTRPCRREPGA